MIWSRTALSWPFVERAEDRYPQAAGEISRPDRDEIKNGKKTGSGLKSSGSMIMNARSEEQLEFARPYDHGIYGSQSYSTRR